MAFLPSAAKLAIDGKCRDNTYPLVGGLYWSPGMHGGNGNRMKMGCGNFANFASKLPVPHPKGWSALPRCEGKLL
jgi:hypothetical protein